MKKFLSWKTVARGFEQCLRRFPAATAYVVLLAAYGIASLWGWSNHLSEKENLVLSYYLSVGCVLSLFLRLWGEEVRRRRVATAVTALLHLLLLADAAYLWLGDVTMESFLTHVSMLTALAISVVTLPFFREKDDMASWNFTLRMAGRALTSWVVGGIACGGICLLTLFFSTLFGTKVDEKVYITWTILLCFALPSLLFIGRVPEGEAKHDRAVLTSAFFEKTVRYLFLPLTGCYLAVLYVYALKILFQWQLPEGMVSAPVSVLAAGCIAVELCLYPSLRHRPSSFDGRVARLLPLAVLPLLALMTVAIARRVGDYGITLNRLYLLTLNVWFYAVCIGLYVSRGRRVQWIPLSFAAVFLLTSALPVNYTSITRWYLFRSVSAQVRSSYSGKLPMDGAQYADWIASLPPDTARLVNSRFRMLDYDFDDKEILKLVTPNVRYDETERHIKDDYETETAAGKDSTERYYVGATSKDIEIKLHPGYSRMIPSDGGAYIPCGEWEKETMPVPIEAGEAADTFYVRPSDIKAWSYEGKFIPREFPCKPSGNLFVLISFTLDGNAAKGFSFSYSGYYFIRGDAE